MRLAVTLLALLLIGTIAVSAYLLLNSCGLRVPFTQKVITFCESESELRLRDELTATNQANDELAGQVGAVERELARLICKADPPPPPPPPPPPKPKAPPKPKTNSGLAPNAFDSKNISVMEGCWQLSSNYSVRDIRTGQITRFKFWRICFDKNGNGTETMRSTTGVRCNGRLKGRMPGNGTLTMREPGNLKCENGASIFRRDVTCTLDKRGNANCDTYQPETRGRGAATLRRARR